MGHIQCTACTHCGVIRTAVTQYRELTAVIKTQVAGLTGCAVNAECAGGVRTADRCTGIGNQHTAVMHYDVLRLTTGRDGQNTALINRSGIGDAIA